MRLLFNQICIAFAYTALIGVQRIILIFWFQEWTQRSTTCCRRIARHNIPTSWSLTPRSRWRRTPSWTWWPPWLTMSVSSIRCPVSGGCDDCDDDDGQKGWRQWWWLSWYKAKGSIVPFTIDISFNFKLVHLQTYVMALVPHHRWRKCFLGLSMPGCTSTGRT